MRKKLLFTVIFILIPLALTLPSLVYLFNHSLILFPNPRFMGQIEASASPHSTIEEFTVTTQRLTFSCILRERNEGLLRPYSSFVIWLKRENNFFDLSGYDSLFLEIEKTTAENIVIFIKTFLEGISRPEKQEAHTLRHNEFSLAFIPGDTKYRIPLDDFATEDWWYTMLDVPMSVRHDENFKKVSALDFQFIHRTMDPPAEKLKTIVIKKIALHKAYPLYCIILNVLFLLYGLFLLFVSLGRPRALLPYLRQGDSPPLKQLPHKRLQLENQSEAELTRIMEYLAEHYNDPALSSSLLSSQTGIPRAHIAELIAKRYGCTCRQLINRLRIEEAQRLLKTTDRRVLEIALKVGFNDISTFNRWFKKAAGMTPRQYRNT